ncbi:MAG: ATP-binding cassette domain-containing protein [Christensenellaceae bacterium]|jgi:ABC-2 type transport system ATP-binding protein
MKLQIKEVTKKYPNGTVALENVSTTMQSPAFIGLLGPNGAGKSTLMKLITLGLLPTKGELRCDDSPLIKQEKSFKGKLGYLPQEYGLYEELTVYQFLDYVATLKDIKNTKKEIAHVLELCNLQDRKKSRISSLSGGLKQRVGIAQALLGTPEILILDEPTVRLDPEERMRMRNIFVEEAKDKILILSTHIIEDIQSASNRLIVLHKGKICYDGIPNGLIALCAGHVGRYECMHGEEDLLEQEEGLRIVSKIVMPEKTSYRFIGNMLPAYTTEVTPTLEDAYVYVMAKEDGAL